MRTLSIILGAIGAIVASGYAIRRQRAHRREAGASASETIPGQSASPQHNP